MAEDAKPSQAWLNGQTDLAGFRDQSQQLLAHQVAPDAVQWLVQAAALADLYAEPQAPNASRPRAVARAATSIVPASFLRLCESVVLHRDPERFALLYRLLWRLVHEPALRNDPVDADMMRAQHMAHAVRRDIHKMKAYVRFVTVTEPGQAQPLQVAWFEPSHHVVEVAAPWFAKRHAQEHWVIFTPERSVRWDGQHLSYAPGLPRDAVPTESDAQAWLACIDSVFRPATAPA